jgi:glycosyltransferase involved in cell wall biosynthesis
MMPKITIVTPSFNQGQFIESTILSVIDQRYSDLEYIIIDGGSKDQTVSILERYTKHLSSWISEADGGQSAALNKGFASATGLIMGYLNSDDLLLPGSLEAVSRFFQEHPEHQWLVSSTLVGNDVESAQTWHPRVLSLEEFLLGQPFPQQGVFWRSNITPQPWFDEHLSFVMDADFFVRLYRTAGLPGILPLTTSFFRLHSESKTSNMTNVMDAEGLKLLSKCEDLFSTHTMKRMGRLIAYNRFLRSQSEFRQRWNEGLTVRATGLPMNAIGLSYLVRSGYSGAWRGIPVIVKSLYLAASSHLEQIGLLRRKKKRQAARSMDTTF